MSNASKNIEENLKRLNSNIFSLIYEQSEPRHKLNRIKNVTSSKNLSVFDMLDKVREIINEGE